MAGFDGAGAMAVESSLHYDSLPQFAAKILDVHLFLGNFLFFFMCLLEYRMISAQ